MQRSGFTLCPATIERLLKLDEIRKSLAQKRATSAYRAKEYKCRQKKRKKNHSHKNRRSLPYRNQNALNDMTVQLIAGL